LFRTVQNLDADIEAKEMRPRAEGPVLRVLDTRRHNLMVTIAFLGGPSSSPSKKCVLVGTATGQFGFFLALAPHRISLWEAERLNFARRVGTR